MGGCEGGVWNWGRVIDEEGVGDGVISWGGNSLLRRSSRQPYRAGPKAGEDTLKLRCSGTILRGFSRFLLGPVLIALGPALKGCPLDRCVLWLRVSLPIYTIVGLSLRKSTR